ncbi:ribonuclease H-like protein [Penicillium malachiteum]|uniref:ribonuclease H-like protein n=1 Tax=Penicillium malachiteum TaxID=1324776 RepID=UPI0025469DC6|nr:ribonuclease H-like protein [Penicillium malachiteum]KAJ5736211.1 ribonuclease H-like protein [Penicillium malachiteum]
MSNDNRRHYSNLPPYGTVASGFVQAGVFNSFTLPPRTFDSLWFGTGCIFPEKFIPPYQDPASLFKPYTIDKCVPAKRLVHRDLHKTFILYTDGACLNNGAPNARAGCAFVFGKAEQNSYEPTCARFPLENKGPTGEYHRQTSNRAELRAVLAASRFCDWRVGRFNRMVIATDSEYVVEGITTGLRNWIPRGWRLNDGSPVMNQDLWACLLGEVERWHTYGMKMEFWRVSRLENREADRFASIAASERREDSFQDHRLGV